MKIHGPAGLSLARTISASIRGVSSAAACLTSGIVILRAMPMTRMASVSTMFILASIS
ncbi:hypothetical protein [Ensifer canadensis]